MTNIEELVKSKVRDVPDFPKPGIVFKDITPIFQDPKANALLLESLKAKYDGEKVDVVLGIDSRGFLLGNALAMQLGIPFVMARKQGKLPADTVSETYQLEYGEATLELHKDALKPGDKVLIHDDLLATGGSAACAASLVQQLGGELFGFNFIIELEFLNGRKMLQDLNSNIVALATY